MLTKTFRNRLRIIKIILLKPNIIDSLPFLVSITLLHIPQDCFEVRMPRQTPIRPLKLGQLEKTASLRQLGNGEAYCFP